MELSATSDQHWWLGDVGVGDGDFGYALQYILTRNKSTENGVFAVEVVAWL